MFSFVVIYELIIQYSCVQFFFFKYDATKWFWSDLYLNCPWFSATMNYPKNPGFILYQSRHCEYITYSAQIWVLKNISVASRIRIPDPPKWNGSERIRIHYTDWEKYHIFFCLLLHSICLFSIYCIFLEFYNFLCFSGGDTLF